MIVALAILSAASVVNSIAVIIVAKAFIKLNDTIEKERG